MHKLLPTLSRPQEAARVSFTGEKAKEVQGAEIYKTVYVVHNVSHFLYLEF